MTYPVNSVNNPVFDDSVARENPSATNEDVTAVNRDSDSGAGKCLVCRAVDEVRGEDGEPDNEMAAKNLSKGFIGQVYGDGSVIWCQEGDARNGIKLADKTGSVQCAKGSVSSEMWEGDGQQPRKREEATLVSVLGETSQKGQLTEKQDG